MANVFRMDPSAAAKILLIADRARDHALDDIAEDARRYAPVATGELVSSIRVNKSEGTVEATANHAVYVELGTSDTPAQPFLRPALYKRRTIRGGSV